MLAELNYTGQFELSHLVHEKIATFVVYFKYESVLLKEVREDYTLHVKLYIKKLRPVTLVKQMYSCRVAKNSLKENCMKNLYTDIF